LIENFEGSIRKLMDFLGEDFEETMLRYHEKPKFHYAKNLEKPPDASNKNHEQHRNWQINQKMFDGRGRWKDLTVEKKDTIKRIAGQMLIDYGYTTDLNW
jgi:hypothetical protein